MFHVEIQTDPCHPIAPIIEYLPRAIVNIAPERETELLGILDGVTLRICDTDEVFARALSSESLIEMSRGLIESIWCATYAYYGFDRELGVQLQLANGAPFRPSISAESNPEIANAQLTLTAALSGQIDWDSLPVCPGTPPEEFTANTPLEAHASELSLVALAFIALHELGHIELDHVGDPDSNENPGWTMDMEREADQWAIDWIFNQAGNARQAAIAKRACGIVFATGLLCARRMRRVANGEIAPAERQTHPQPYERMNAALHHTTVVFDELVTETMYRIACSVLMPHIRYEEFELLDGPYDGFSRLYVACLDSISRHLVR